MHLVRRVCFSVRHERGGKQGAVEISVEDTVSVTAVTVSCLHLGLSFKLAFQFERRELRRMEKYLHAIIWNFSVVAS